MSFLVSSFMTFSYSKISLMRSSWAALMSSWIWFRLLTYSSFCIFNIMRNSINATMQLNDEIKHERDFYFFGKRQRSQKGLEVVGVATHPRAELGLIVWRGKAFCSSEDFRIFAVRYFAVFPVYLYRFTLSFVEMIAFDHQQSIVLLLCLNHSLYFFFPFFEVPQRSSQLQDLLDSPLYFLCKLFILDFPASGRRLLGLTLVPLVEVELAMMDGYLFLVPKLIFEAFLGLHDHIFLLFVYFADQQDRFRLLGPFVLLTLLGLQSFSVMLLGLFVLVLPHVCQKAAETFLFLLPLEVRVGAANIRRFIGSFWHESVEHILVKPFASFATFGVAEMILGEVQPGLKLHLSMIFMIVRVILMRRCIGDTEVQVVLQRH